jgi:hypothetical protein
VVYVDLEEEENVIIFPSISGADTGGVGAGDNDGTNMIESSNSDGNNDKKKENENHDKMEVVNNGINLESVSISLTEMDQVKETETTVKIEKPVKPTKYEKAQLLKKNIFTEPVITNLSKYFLERVDPSPRINPCLMVMCYWYLYYYYCCCRCSYFYCYCCY